HVFSELDFTVETVHEPFAAVKKFMAHRYDAVSWTARTNRTLPCCSRAQEIPASIKARWRSPWSKGKRAWPRPIASAPTWCLRNRSTSNRQRERFGLREGSCGRTLMLPVRQLRLLYPTAIHFNRQAAAQKRWLQRQAAPSFPNLKPRYRR